MVGVMVGSLDGSPEGTTDQLANSEGKSDGCSDGPTTDGISEGERLGTSMVGGAGGPSPVPPELGFESTVGVPAGESVPLGVVPRPSVGAATG